MKTKILLLLYIFIANIVHAQAIVSVGAGTNLSVGAGTIFSTGTLSFTPSVNFIMNGLAVNQAATVTHSTVNTYVSRVFQFSNNTNPFSGSIRIGYLDAELNGLQESNLRVTANDGSSWLSFPSAANDAVNNYVTSIAVSNRTISELTLATAFAVLPLQWGNVKATRIEQQQKIEWNTLAENNVSGFTVEKSYDAVSWSVLKDKIPAANATNGHSYAIIDYTYEMGKTYYRIKQSGYDGNSSYSPIVQIAPLATASEISLYPNPTSSSFNIIKSSNSALRQVRLFNNIGTQVKTWATAQSSYKIEELPAGLYRVQVLLADGSTKWLNILKQ
ncbi:MAG: T9SS type A sorting domain-containing protein [Chitinophagaceae bacterium]